MAALTTTYVVRDDSETVTAPASEYQRVDSQIGGGLTRTAITHDVGDPPPVGTEIRRWSVDHTSNASNRTVIRERAEQLVGQIENAVATYRTPGATDAQRQSFILDTYDDVLVALGNTIRLAAGLFDTEGVE